MSCTNTDTGTPIMSTLNWVTGTDEELVLRYVSEVDGIKTPIDLTGYSAVMDIMVKDTDVVPTLSIPAIIDNSDGLFIFKASDVDTQALLTNTRQNNYIHQVEVTNQSGEKQRLVTGKLIVRV